MTISNRRLIVNLKPLIDDAVQRLLKKEGIQTQTRCISTDPKLAAKAADSVGSVLEGRFAIAIVTGRVPFIRGS